MTGADRWAVAGADDLPTPCLAVFPEIVRENLAAAVRLAGGPGRLRPHVKTHKCAEIVALEVAAGVAKHKAATIAEAELLATAGAADVLLAYPLVGPNVARFLRLAALYPRTAFRALVDHANPARLLDRAAAAAGTVAEVFVDLDVGMGRTGVAPRDLPALAAALRSLAHLRVAGLHAYDGQVHDADPAVRAAQVDAVWTLTRAADETLGGVDAIVCGGTGSFPRWAALAAADPRLECSPGTVLLHDAGYAERFAEQPFVPAALVLTRVVSKRGPDILTLDLGSKAVASDSPPQDRVRLLELPGAETLAHNEEHLVVRHAEAGRFRHGDLLRALPRHICPTVALHREMAVFAAGRPAGRWLVAARDRQLTV